MLLRSSKKRGRPRGSANKTKCQCLCEWCGDDFWSAIPTALTCSNAHRLRWTRWARKHLAIRGFEPACGPRGNEQWQQSPHRPPPKPPQPKR